MNSKFLYGFVIAFLAGVAAASAWEISFAGALFVVLVAACLGAYAFAGRKEDTRLSASPIFFAALVLFAAGLGMLRVDMARRFSDAGIFDKYVEERVEVRGIVAEEPRAGERSVQFALAAKEVCDESGCAPAEAKVLARADPYASVRYGDEVRLEGVLERPEEFETDGGRMFDYPAYLAKEGIYYIVNAKTFEVPSSGHGFFLKRRLFDLKHTFLTALSSVVPEPEASLLAGISIGATEGLSSELEEEFRRAGVIHIVVASGYNITIVAESVRAALAWLSRPVSLWGAGMGVALFALLAGGTATVVRAAIMALVVILGKALRRRYDITRALMIAGFGMVLHNPLILLHDPSFQLSFLATLGLVYGPPVVARFVRWLPQRLGMRQVATETLATQLFVLPLLLHMTGLLSIVALPANILILWLVPLEMFLTLAAGGLGMLSRLAALPLGGLAYAGGAYILGVVHFFTSLPFAALTLPRFSVWVLFLLYALLAWVVVVQHKRVSMKVTQKIIRGMNVSANGGRMGE